MGSAMSRCRKVSNRTTTLSLIMASFVLAACVGLPHAPVTSEQTPGYDDPPEPPEGLVGSVRDIEGRPIARAGIGTKALEGQPVTPIGTFTDARGRYVRDGLRPGEYLVTVYVDNFPEASKRVSIERGELSVLNFVLEPAP